MMTNEQAIATLLNQVYTVRVQVGRIESLIGKMIIQTNPPENLQGKEQIRGTSFFMNWHNDEGDEDEKK